MDTLDSMFEGQKFLGHSPKSYTDFLDTFAFILVDAFAKE